MSEEEKQKPETEEARAARINQMAIRSMEFEIQDDRAEYNRLSQGPQTPEVQRKMEYLSKNITRLGMWIDKHWGNV